MTGGAHQKQQGRTKGKHPGRHEATVPGGKGASNARNNMANMQKIIWEAKKDLMHRKEKLQSSTNNSVTLITGLVLLPQSLCSWLSSLLLAFCPHLRLSQFHHSTGTVKSFLTMRTACYKALRNRAGIEALERCWPRPCIWELQYLSRLEMGHVLNEMLEDSSEICFSG